MGSRSGSLAVAAGRVGLTVDEYEAHVDAGEKWCSRCKAWHPLDAFGRDASRGDGRAPSCRESKNRHGRVAYEPKPGPDPGRRFVPARDGDKRQARRRVNHLVDVGLLPHPGDVPCADCGHLGDGPRHEYDHHLGYAAEHHEDVEAVCAPCHHRREVERSGRSNVD